MLEEKLEKLIPYLDDIKEIDTFLVLKGYDWGYYKIYVIWKEYSNQNNGYFMTVDELNLNDFLEWLEKLERS